MNKQVCLYYLRIGGILLLICALMGGLLAGINALTAPVIATAQAEKTNAAIADFFADTTEAKPLTLAAAPENVVAAYRAERDGVVLGFAYQVAPKGFKGEVSLLVGVYPNGTVCGVTVLSHSETGGIGTKVLTADNLAQYLGQSGALTLGDEVDAVTGATITSRAVLAGVNAALAAHEQVVRGGASA